MTATNYTSFNAPEICSSSSSSSSSGGVGGGYVWALINDDARYVCKDDGTYF